MIATLEHDEHLGMQPRPTRRRRRRVAVSLAEAEAVAGTVTAAAAYAFQPCKLVVDDTVNEPLSTMHPGAAGGADAPSARAVPTTPATSRSSPEARTYARSTTRPGACASSGCPTDPGALRVEDLTTPNGPALKIWLAVATVRVGRNGWLCSATPVTSTSAI